MLRLKSSIEITKPVQFALDKLSAVAEQDIVLMLTRDESIGEQGYVRDVAGEGEVCIAASDDAGFMYALLDLRDLVRNGGEIGGAKRCPYLKKRGLKFNIPLDSRAPSYTDAADSARKNIVNMWDKDFWAEYFDRMAEEKYNVISLWNLCPYPSMVRIPEFPNLYLDDVKVSARSFRMQLSGKGIYDEDHRRNLYTVKKMTIDEKISFWQWVMEYAKSRCIEVYLFTWNIFDYGTEDSGYGITDDPNNPETRKYIYYGTKALLDTYPLLAGIGVTAGENMIFNGHDTGDTPYSQTDVGFISETYGQACRDYCIEHPDRHFLFIFRLMMASYDQMMTSFSDYPGDFQISFKYSMAHMYSDTKPGFINDFMKEKSPDIPIWLTVRNDDFYMYRWGNPEFAAEYLSNMPVQTMTGFYMGPDGFTWARDYMTREDTKHGLFIDRMWYMFKIWGQLSYNPELGTDYFVRELSARFSISMQQAEHLYKAWKAASSIVPALTCVHWHHYDFQWYPEGCCMFLPEYGKLVFANIREFVECGAMPYSAYVSVHDCVENEIADRQQTGPTPVDAVHAIKGYVSEAVSNLGEMTCDPGPELAATIADIRSMCILGRYYMKKEQAALNLCRYEKTGNPALKQEAVSFLEECAVLWKKYSSAMVSRYIPQVLGRLCGKVCLTDFDEYADLDVLLAKEW